MTNWMRSMGLGGAGTALLSRPSMAAFFSSAYQKPLSLTSLRTPLYLFSFLPRPHRKLSAPAASFSSVPSLNDNDDTSDFGDGDWTAVSRNGSKLLLKGMTYAELENWVQSYGYRPGQAMMLWKRMYGNNIWAHHSDELEGLNKDFKKMLSENAEFRALSLKEIHAASDGTRKDVADSVHIGRWTCHRNSCNSL